MLRPTNRFERVVNHLTSWEITWECLQTDGLPIYFPYIILKSGDKSIEKCREDFLKCPSMTVSAIVV